MKKSLFYEKFLISLYPDKTRTERYKGFLPTKWLFAFALTQWQRYEIYLSIHNQMLKTFDVLSRSSTRRVKNQVRAKFQPAWDSRLQDNLNGHTCGCRENRGNRRHSIVMYRGK